MTATHLSGPLLVGTNKDTASSTTANQGYALLAQTATLTANSTTAVSATMTLPENAQIVDIIPDVTTAFDSATSALLNVGYTANGTEYANGISVKTTGRKSLTLTASTLATMANVGSHTSLISTITPTGATTTGIVTITARYIQK